MPSACLWSKHLGGLSSYWWKKKFQELDLLTYSRICPAKEFLELLTQYGEILKAPPEEAYESYRYVFWPGSEMQHGDFEDAYNFTIWPKAEPSAWHVEFCLWTEFSGQSPSDWKLVLEITDRGDEAFEIELRTIYQ